MMTLEDIGKRLDKIERMTLLAAKAVLDTEDVAMLTGYSVTYVAQLVKSRQIPFYRRGNRRFFDRAEIEKWMLGARIPTNEEISTKAVGYRK